VGNSVHQPRTPNCCWPAVHISVLIFASILLCLPVLTKPHWGTFDDANIIVQLGRRLHEDPSTLTYITTGAPKRAGYFLLLMLLWKLFPENPGAYFLLNSLVFAATLVFTYVNALLLSRRPWLSFATTCLMLTIPGLFEVIYTLDKQEVYLPFLFSMCILVQTVNFRFAPSRTQMLLSALTLSLTSLIAYSFKETSGLLILFSGVVCISAWFQGKAQNYSRLKASISLVATMLPYIFILLRGVDHQYISLTFDPTQVITKLLAYAQLMPLYFVILFLNLFALIPLWRSRSASENNYHRDSSLYLALVACCIAAPIAFASFDTFNALLLYIWFPIYVFLLPALALAIASLANKRKNLEAAAILSMIVFTLMDFPVEWLRGQFQVSMDTLTHEVAKSGAVLCKGSSSQIVGALPTFNPMAYEVPEDVEFFIRDQLEPGYFDKANEKPSEHNFAMLNFLTTNMDNAELSSLKKDFRLPVPSSYLCQPDFTGWRGYQMLTGATPFRHWVSRPFPKNSLLFIPYGNVPQKIAHRGQGLFGNDVQNNLYCFPQLKLAEVCTLEKNIHNIYGEKYKLGWKIYRVLDAQPISLPGATSDSWLSSDQKLFYNSPKRILEFESTQPISANWLVIDEQGKTQDFSTRLQGGRLHANVYLPKAEPGRHWVQFHNKNKNEKLHCDMVRLTTAREMGPRLELTMDSWLIDGATISFDDEVNNHKLFLKSDMNFANGIFVQGLNKTSVKVHDHMIEIPLSDGCRLQNGLQCLTIHAAVPLQLQRENEHRPLIIHVTGTSASM
jgi:hypothetical protein